MRGNLSSCTAISLKDPDERQVVTVCSDTSQSSHCMTQTSKSRSWKKTDLEPAGICGTLSRLTEPILVGTCKTLSRFPGHGIVIRSLFYREVCHAVLATRYIEYLHIAQIVEHVCGDAIDTKSN
eukprot:gnl/TRDRNA2_/TRDRNA2_138987_c0_seq1.p1 gnl/TRDRNA2_/TRDRNA2_138987_c0~~gnl/TRDRNA2_/TRDRNA2_138987_c0_seq1.p1  ORF type:complete len:124 (+),score=5.12 gnl/TRDRNA2_/TRDRNA2_138987_c0_seq1:272-643(+)